MTVNLELHDKPLHGPSGYSFRLDRLDVMRDFMERNLDVTGRFVGSRGIRKDVEVNIEVLEGGVIQFGERMHNAGWAIHSTLDAGGETLNFASLRLAKAYYSLAEIREGLKDGTAMPDDVTEVLAEIDGMRTDVGRAVLLKNVVAIGRDAIDASLPHEHEIRDEADLRAMASI